MSSTTTGVATGGAEVAAPEASCLPDTSDCYDPDYSQK